MKKTITKLSMLLFMLLMGVGNAWATVVSIDLSNQGFENGQSISSVNIDENISVSFSNGTNKNDPKYYTSGTAVRCYGGNYFDVRATDVTITEIKITFGSGEGSNAITTDCGTFSSPTWTGEASSVRFTIGGTSDNRRIQKLEVTYSSSSEELPVSKPIINPYGGTFYGSQEVSITCATEGATIVYTTDDWNTSNTYNGPFTITETTTVKTKASMSGMTDSDEATATFTLVYPLTTCDEIFAAATEAGSTATDCYVAFNNWVVSGVKGSNCYVTDGTKGFIIYQSNHGFEAGDVLSGMVACQVLSYNGAAEFKGVTSTSEGLTVTKGGTITPQVVGISDLSGVNTGAVVTINDVGYDGTHFFDANQSIIKPFAAVSSSLPVLTIGKKYNVTGVYVQFNGTREIAPRNDDDIEESTSEDGYEIQIEEGIENGTVTVSTDNAVEGTTITITVTPDEHYVLDELVVSGQNSGDPIAVTNNKFVMPAEDVNINAYFVRLPRYAVTFTSLGVELRVDSVYEGDCCANAPEVTNAPEGWTFVGWTTATVEETDESPTFFKVESTPINESVTLKAVFKMVEVEGEGCFNKITSEPDDWSGEYLLVYEGDNTHPAVAWTGIDASGCGVETYIVDDIIQEIPENAVSLTIAPMTGGYSIQINGGDNDEKYIYGKSGSNALQFDEAPQLNSLDCSEDGVIITSNTSVMRYNSTSTANQFRYYKSSTYTSQKPVQLYKLIEGTTYYTTEPVGPVAQKYEIEVDATIANGTVTVNKATAAAGETVSITIAPNAGYKLTEGSLVVSTGTVNIDVDVDGKFVMPAAKVYVTAGFEKIVDACYTVSFHSISPGASFASVEFTPGTILENIPIPTNTPAGWTFIGWTTAISNFASSTAPELFDVTSPVSIEEDFDLFAVFSRKGTGAECPEQWVKVTEEQEDWSGEYLLVYEGDNTHPAVAWTGVDAGGCGTAVTINGGVIVEVPEDAVTLTLDPMGVDYSIMVNGGENDGKYISGLSGKNGLKFNDTPADNSVLINDEGELNIISVGYALRYNSNSGTSNERFRYYSKGQQPVQLYKKVAGAEEGDTYYITFNSGTSRSVTNGNLGTYCGKYDGAVFGAELYEIANIVMDEEHEGWIKSISFVQIKGETKGYTPYVFKATSDKFELFYTDYSAYKDCVNNGLVGNLQDNPITLTDTQYMIKDNTVKRSNGTATIAKNRAYIDPTQFVAPTEVKGKTFTIEFENETTSINNVMKSLTDNGDWYTIDGRKVAQPTKGIFIKNGVKYIFK